MADRTQIEAAPISLADIMKTMHSVLKIAGKIPDMLVII